MALLGLFSSTVFSRFDLSIFASCAVCHCMSTPAPWVRVLQEHWRDEVLARYEDGVWIFLAVVAVALIATIAWLGFVLL